MPPPYDSSDKRTPSERRLDERKARKSFTRLLFGPERMALFLSWNEEIGFVALITVIFGGATVFGQCIALGVAVAASEYGWLWLLVAIFFPVMTLIVGQSVGAESYLRHLYRVRRRNRIPPLVRQKAKIKAAARKPLELDYRIVSGLFFLFIFSTVAFMVCFATRQVNPLLSTHHKDELMYLGRLNENQRNTVSELAIASDGLLMQFDGIESGLHNARSNVVSNMTELSKSTVELNSIAQKISALQNERSQMSLKMQGIQKLLEGETPITRGYFDNSGTIGLIVGSGIGFIGSILANFAYAWICSKRQTRLHQEGNVTGIADADSHKIPPER